MVQLGGMDAYETEIEQLRDEMNSIFVENSQLVDQITNLEEEKNYLIQTVQKKTKENETFAVEVKP